MDMTQTRTRKKTGTQMWTWTLTCGLINNRLQGNFPTVLYSGRWYLAAVVYSSNRDCGTIRNNCAICLASISYSLEILTENHEFKIWPSAV
jgi:hypothetical protein